MKKSFLLRSAFFAFLTVLAAGAQTMAQTGPVQHFIAGTASSALTSGQLIAVAADEQMPGAVVLSMDNAEQEKVTMLISGPEGVVYVFETRRPRLHFRFDLSSLPEGFYRLTIKRPGKRIVQRFRLRSDAFATHRKVVF